MNEFYTELNKRTVDAVKNNTAFFMQSNNPHIPIISNSFTGNPITGANYFNLQLSNDLNGTHHTEYVKMNEVQSARPDWLSKLPGGIPQGVLYQEEHSPSNVPYTRMLPTAELNQTIITDNHAGAIARDHYIPFQSNETKMNDFNNFVLEQCTNAINASFTNCAFKSNIPEKDLNQFKSMLAAEMAKNPGFIAEIADKAHQQVIDHHYIPFDKKRFIEKARDENSETFNQLRSAVADHVEDMYVNKKPSFNREFNELSKPLVIKIENLHLGSPDPRPAVDNEITEFVKKQIRQDKTATILADVFAGTIVEKAIKIARTGKRIFTGIVLAGALFKHNSNAGGDIADSLLSAVNRHKIPDHYPDHNKVVINNRVFKGSELLKILNFDNAPFDMTGNGKIESRDYEFAHRAERAILAMTPTINRDEYCKDMTHNQTALFVKTVSTKTGSGTQVNDFITIAGNIANHPSSVCRDTADPRSFYAGLNQTIRSNPQTLDHAIAQLRRNNQNDHHKPHSAAMSRR